MSDLKFVIDNPEGVGIALGGAYEGWTIDRLEWLVQNPGAGARDLTVAKLLTPSSDPETHLLPGGHRQARAIVEISGPLGQSQTLESALIQIGYGSDRSGEAGKLNVTSLEIDSATGLKRSFTAAFANTEWEAVTTETKFQADYRRDFPEQEEVTTYAADGTRTHHDVPDIGPDAAIVRRIEEDGDGVFWYGRASNHPWKFRQWDWNEQGNLDYLTIVYDDWVTEFISYETRRPDDIEQNLEIKNVLRIDYEDNHSYQNQFIVYDDGVISKIENSNDNETRTKIYYHLGEIHRIKTTDPARTTPGAPDEGANGNFDWKEREVYFGAPESDAHDGRAVSRRTVYDDGRVIHTDYGRTEDGTAVAVWTGADDVDDAYDWTMKSSLHDANGDRAATTVTYDDGVIEQLTYEAGILATGLILDPENTRPFASVTRSYRDGALAVHVALRDDGGVTEVRLANGIRTSRLSEDTGDTRNWESVLEIYDATGKLAQQTNVYDDGRKVVAEFAGGIRSAATMTDVDDAYDWSSHTSRYDAAGVLAGRVTVFDDGRVTEALYDDGRLASVVVSDTGDAFLWTSRSSTYDADGTRSLLRTIHDDGREEEASFSAGRQTGWKVTDTGDAFVWSSASAAFDAEGHMTSQTRIFDDGRELVTTFADGIRETAVMTDAADAYRWSTYTDSFDETGALTARAIRYDDGREIFIDDF